MASVSPVVTRAGHAGFGLGVTARLAPCSRTVVTRRTAVPSSLLRLPGRRTLSGGIVRPLPVYDAAWAGHTVGMHSMAAKRVVRRTVAQRIAAIPATYPLAFGAVFTCSKTLAADSFVQLVLEKKEELDLRRLAVFGASFAVSVAGLLLRGCCCECVALTRSPLRVLSFRRRVWLRVDGYVVVAMCATLAAHRRAQCVVSLICCICCFTGGFQYFFYARLLTSLFPRTSCSRLVVGCGGAGCGCFEGLGLTHNCAWLINNRSRCVRCQADAREVA